MSEATGTIYCFTSKKSGKSYVGQSWDFGNRYGIDGAGASGAFRNAIMKYGWNNFDVVILDEGIAEQTELDECECFWMEYLGTRVPFGYNLKEGGNCGRLSERTKQKISQALKGQKKSVETRARMSAAQKGRTFSEESRKKMSMSRRGKKLSEQHKQNISAGNKGKNKGQIPWSKGRPMTEEQKAKISAAHKGKVYSLETRRKMSESAQGKILSDETRKKMAEFRYGKPLSKKTRENMVKAWANTELRKRVSEKLRGKCQKCGLCGLPGHKRSTCENKAALKDESVIA